ncbi:hypothetical protein [Galbitalea sp. SE-J8]|uniref:hypothetical protein n=1 Tax=Galbitalea sp. SE-J8 TaxID=3054952 RepID=UPI00338E2037
MTQPSADVPATPPAVPAPPPAVPAPPPVEEPAPPLVEEPAPPLVEEPASAASRRLETTTTATPPVEEPASAASRRLETTTAPSANEWFRDASSLRSGAPQPTEGRRRPAPPVEEPASAASRRLETTTDHSANEWFRDASSLRSGAPQPAEGRRRPTPPAEEPAPPPVEEPASAASRRLETTTDHSANEWFRDASSLRSGAPQPTEGRRRPAPPAEEPATAASRRLETTTAPSANEWFRDASSLRSGAPQPAEGRRRPAPPVEEPASAASRRLETTTTSTTPAPGVPQRWLASGVDRVLSVQRPVVLAHLRGIRSARPQATPAEVVATLERRYLAAVTMGGAAVGAASVLPVVGVGASFALSAVETGGFLEASALFAQSVAEVHGIAVDDPERARALVMALVLGSAGGDLVRQLAGQAAGVAPARQRYWGELVTKQLPKAALGRLGGELRSRFVRRFAASQGASAIGRAIPFGIGAVVGGVGNHLLGRQIVRGAREAFGPAPLENGPARLRAAGSSRRPQPPATSSR